MNYPTMSVQFCSGRMGSVPQWNYENLLSTPWTWLAGHAPANLYLLCENWSIDTLKKKESKKWAVCSTYN